LLERDAQDCVERGYLLIPVWLDQMRSGDYDGGFRTLRRRPRSANVSATGAALQCEVVAAWQQFTDDGTLTLQLGITTASARK
jgi:hypothetical protein